MMKTKLIYLLILILAFEGAKGQIGINTPTPRGALDINTPTTNTMGLVLPTNSSAESVVNPLGGIVALGTTVYDSTKDCVRVYKSTGWSNCIGDNTGSSGTSGNWPYATSLRFKTLHHGGTETVSVGIATTGEVYTWGRNYYGEVFLNGVRSNLDNANVAMTPVKVPVITNAVKAYTIRNQFLALTSSGVLYYWGCDTGNIGQGNTGTGTNTVLNTPATIAPPSGTKWVDLYIDRTYSPAGAVVGVTDNGNAYVTFFNSSSGGVYTWTAVAKPTGAVAGFKYTKAWLVCPGGSLYAGSYPTGNAGTIYLEGSDGNYYSSGGNAYRQIGNSAYTANNYDFTTSAGIVKVNLPSGTVIDKIRGGKTLSSTVIIDTSGKAYMLGAYTNNTTPNISTSLMPSSEATAVTVSGVKTFPNPVLALLPSGATKFYDVVLTDNIGHATVSTDAGVFFNGYIQTGTLIYSDLTIWNLSSQYTTVTSGGSQYTNGYVVAKASNKIILTELDGDTTNTIGGIMGLDTSGQIWAWGRNFYSFTGMYGGVSTASSYSSVAMPMLSGAYQANNPRP